MHIIFQDKQALLCFGFILHFEKFNFDLILVCLLMNFNNIDFVLDCPIFSDQWSIDFFHSLRLHFLFLSFFENLILFLNTCFLKNTGYTTRRSFLNGVLIYRHSMTDTFFLFSLNSVHFYFAGFVDLIRMDRRGTERSSGSIQYYMYGV